MKKLTRKQTSAIAGGRACGNDDFYCLEILIAA